MVDITREKFVEDVTNILVEMRGQTFYDMADSIWLYLQSYSVV